MSVILDNIDQIEPFLTGRKFHENFRLEYKKQGPVRYRVDLIVERCREKKVLHVGCCDHLPRIAEEIAGNRWLHGLVSEESSMTIGVDIDREAIELASSLSKLDNIIYGNMASPEKIPQIANTKFDVVLLGDMLTLLSDPIGFLRNIREVYGECIGEIVITVPNAYRGGNIRGAFLNWETACSESRFFFTPYTLCKTAFDAGFVPRSVEMASYTRAGQAKAWVLNRFPLLAETIVFTGVPRTT